MAENTAAGQNVGAALTATDADSDTLTYTLEGTDAASFDIVSGSGQIRTRTGVTYNHEAKSTHTVVVKADDGNGGTDTVTVTIAVTDVDEPPGQPAAPTVSATAGSTTSLDVTWTAPTNTGPAIASYDLQYRAGTSGNFTNGPQNVTGTSAAIGSLAADTSYEVQVRATNAEGDGDWSVAGTGRTTATSAPGAPTGLTATASGTTAINLSWSAPASTGGSAITGYKIEVSPNGTSGWTDQVANTNSTATTYAHTGLAAGDTRHYRVSAINANGTGTASNVDSATTGHHRARRSHQPRGNIQRDHRDQPLLERPGQHRRLRHHRLQDRGLAQRHLRLDRPGRQHQQHRHHLRPHRAGRRRHPPLPRLRHQHQRRRHRLQRRQRHHRHQRARRPHRPHGNGQRDHRDQPLLERPGQHRRLRHHRLQDRGLGQRHLRLDRPGRQHQQHRHHLRAHRADRRHTRHYRVSAINTNGTGDPSNVDSATTDATVPGAPTGLTATASGTTAINLSWSAPGSTGGSAITGYKIEVSPNGTSGWTDQVANTNSTATTYAHTGLGGGTTRHYRVSAINANGAGTASNVANATTGATAPGAPTGLTATASGTTAIDLSWSAPASTGGSAITGYKIEVSANGTSGWTDQVANTNSTANTSNTTTTYAHTGLAAGDHPPLPRLRHQRQRRRHRLQRRQRHHRHHRPRRPHRPHGHGQRDHRDQPLLERPGQHRRLRHHRLQDRGLGQRHLRLDRPGRQHQQHRHHLRPHRAGRPARLRHQPNGAGTASTANATTAVTLPAHRPRQPPAGSTAINLSWSAPGSTGGSAITGYKIEVSPTAPPAGPPGRPPTAPPPPTRTPGSPPATRPAGPPRSPAPLLERPGEHRRLRHHRLQDRGLGQRHLRLDRPGRQHQQHRHHLRPHRARRRRHPPLPRLRHQRQRHRHPLQRRQRHHATTGATAPGAPTGLTATASGTTAINLSWSAPASTGGSAITGYKIEVSANGTSGWTDQVANTNSTATTYAHTGLTAGDTRHYRVSAINANGTGTASNVANATTDATVPGAPTGLTATASGTTAINLSWSAPGSTGGSAITGYRIEVSANGTSGWTDQVANTNSTATTYAHTGLTAGDTRHYRVSAINANGTGTASNVAAPPRHHRARRPDRPHGTQRDHRDQPLLERPGEHRRLRHHRLQDRGLANGTSGWTDQVANTNSTATTYAHTGLTAATPATTASPPSTPTAPAPPPTSTTPPRTPPPPAPRPASRQRPAGPPRSTSPGAPRRAPAAPPSPATRSRSRPTAPPAGPTRSPTPTAPPPPTPTPG